MLPGAEMFNLSISKKMLSSKDTWDNLAENKMERLGNLHNKMLVAEVFMLGSWRDTTKTSRGSFWIAMTSQCTQGI